MDITKFITQFLYRIRYRLLWGSLLVTLLVIYFTQFLPYSYTVEGSLYAGVTNEVSIDGTRFTATAVNSTFENLIGIAKSQSTLQKVSVQLLANALTYGEEWNDNQYIQAIHYRQLIDIAPKEVLSLVNRKDVHATAEALWKYRREGRNNFVYAMFNRNVPFYSMKALEGVNIERIKESDILRLRYTSADPGMTQQTLILLIAELKKAYEELRFSATNDVIAYFEEQVKLSKEVLSDAEDDLTRYCVSARVINYPEETEALSATRYEVDDRLELARRQYESAKALRIMLDNKMDIRADIIRNNTELLQQLDQISTLNQRITEQEIFISSEGRDKDNRLMEDRTKLKEAEKKVNDISDNLNLYNFSKEGVGIQNMVDEWLASLINEAKAGAELKVLKERQQEIFEQYSAMSPVGTQVSRKERAVSIAEDNYRNQIHGLAEANLRKRSIEMSTSNLRDVTVPEYPLSDNGRKRGTIVMAAFFGSLVFIITYFLIIELLDHTLRDPIRSLRLTQLPVIAAFNGVSNLQYRGFLKACNRIAAAYSCRQMNKFLQPDRPTVINLFSLESGEGKSYLCRYFISQWNSEGLHVRLVKSGLDFDPHSKIYLQAQKFSDFWQLNSAEKIPDIILVEYPAASTSSLPLPVLQSSDLNVLVSNACRLWRNSDNQMLEPIKEKMAETSTPLYLYLNNADRDVVESFTGDLPPHTFLHTFFSRLAQLGLTARRAAVK